MREWGGPHTAVTPNWLGNLIVVPEKYELFCWCAQAEKANQSYVITRNTVTESKQLTMICILSFPVERLMCLYRK